MTEFNTIGELADFLGVEPETLRGGLNLTEGAEILGIGVSTLRSLGLGGRIGFRRAGRRWIFGWRDIAAYIEREHQTPHLENEHLPPLRDSRESSQRSPQLTEDDVRRAREHGLI